jgi:ribose transport system substrate-binding protein
MRWVLLTLVLGLMAGCGGKETTSDGPRIALVMKARTNPFFARMEAGAREAAKAAGCDLTVLSIERETDFDKQAGLIEDMVAQGVDAILIAPADSKAVVAPLMGAQTKGIYIINLDNKIDAEAAEAAGLKVHCFVGPDNAAGAYKATSYLLDQMGSAGQIAILEGIRGVDNAEARKRGFMKAVEEAGDDVQLVASESAEWETEMAMEKTNGILQRFPDLAGLFCANDSMALGAIQAIAAMDKQEQVKVAGYDNLDAARDAMAKGLMVCTIEQNPESMGAIGVEKALDLIAGESVESVVPVETELITAP